jgi:outer membrane protein assembly factor BamB
MKRNTIKIFTVGVLTTLLCACSGFFDKDNTPTPSPLTKYTFEAHPQKLWSSQVNFGAEDDYLMLVPALSDKTIFTASRAGIITATNKTNGNTVWRHEYTRKFSAGPAVDNNLVFLGSRSGKILAVSQLDGSKVWETQLSSEVLASPAAGHGMVLAKTIDGQLTALAESDGHVMWHYQQTEPALILRGGSTPQIVGEDAIVGFENGNLAKLTLREGSMIWETPMATPQGTFAIQRMIDIDDDPVIFSNNIYAATYQGKISALELSGGRTIWTHDISSFTGLTVDSGRVYVSDADSNLWAFDRDSGTVDWRGTQLQARNISGPALMDKYIVVGDGQGYIHWLSREDGHFIARARVGLAAIVATPVVDNQTVYVLTKEGYLAAYKLT